MDCIIQAERPKFINAEMHWGKLGRVHNLCYPKSPLGNAMRYSGYITLKSEFVYLSTN
jgi:hypothetical protein